MHKLIKIIYLNNNKMHSLSVSFWCFEGFMFAGGFSETLKHTKPNSYRVSSSSRQSGKGARRLVIRRLAVAVIKQGPPFFTSNVAVKFVSLN